MQIRQWYGHLATNRVRPYFCLLHNPTFLPSSLGNSWKSIKTKSMSFPKAIFTAISATAHYHLYSTCQPGGVTHTCVRGVNWLNVLTESMYNGHKMQWKLLSWNNDTSYLAYEIESCVELSCDFNCNRFSSLQKRIGLGRVKDWVQLFCTRCLNYPWDGRYRTTNRKSVVFM